MTTYTTQPTYAGEISAFFTLHDPAVQPLLYVPMANPFGHDGDSPATNYVPMGFVDIPGISREADMDDIFPLGTFQRQQRNMMNQRSSARFRVDVQNIDLLSMALRNDSSALNSYDMIVGNASSARVAAGCKVESCDIDIPREGKVTAAFGLQAIIAAPASGSLTPPVIVPETDYDPDAVYYGYNSNLLFNGDDYTQYISRVRIGIRQTLKRQPPLAVNLGTSGSPKWILVSQSLKETRQMVTVSFELFQPLPTNDVIDICRDVNNVTIPLTDYCTPGRSILLSLPNVDFSTDNLDEGSTEDILTFSAEANAQTIVITETSPS